MLIDIVYLLFGLLFMALCYFIAVEVSPGRIRLRNPTKAFLRQYLFAPASPLKATAGMVGSTISFYITIYSCVSVTFGWGSLFILALIMAIPAAFFIFYHNVKRVIDARFTAGMATPAPESIITYIDLAQHAHPTLRRLLWLPLILMTVYVVFTVATEMQALQVLYFHMTAPPAALMPGGAAPAHPSNVVFAYGLFILLACLGYVLRGGYPAIMSIDVLQIGIYVTVSVAALMAMCIAWHPIDLIFGDGQFVGPGRWGRVVTIFLATCVLILCWFTAAVDNWVRIGGTFFDHVIGGNAELISIDAARRKLLRKLRYVLGIAAGLCLLLTIVPSLAGLHLRQQAIAAWEHSQTGCAGATVDKDHTIPDAPDSPDLQQQAGGYFERYLRSEFVLIPDRTCEPASWLGPATADRYQERRFPAFTISPYKYLALLIDDAWEESTQSSSTAVRLGWLVVLGAFVVSVICAVITTVNSYLLTIAQLLHRFFADHPLTQRRWLAEPLAATLLTGAAITVLLSTRVMNEDNYVSFGVMAFGSITFLAPISACAVWERDEPRLRRLLRYLGGGYVVWTLLWLVHMWLQTASARAVLDSDGIAGLLLRPFHPRSFLLMIGFAITVLCLAAAYLPRRQPTA